MCVRVYIYIYIYREREREIEIKIKLATVVERDGKVPLLIATIPRFWGGH